MQHGRRYFGVNDRCCYRFVPFCHGRLALAFGLDKFAGRLLLLARLLLDVCAEPRNSKPVYPLVATQEADQPSLDLDPVGAEDACLIGRIRRFEYD